MYITIPDQAPCEWSAQWNGTSFVNHTCIKVGDCDGYCSEIVHSSPWTWCECIGGQNAANCFGGLQIEEPEPGIQIVTFECHSSIFGCDNGKKCKAANDVGGMQLIPGVNYVVCGCFSS